MIDNMLANDELWEPRWTKEKKAKVFTRQEVRKCGCGRYEHCQNCEEERL
jgi:hypothetical protein